MKIRRLLIILVFALILFWVVFSLSKPSEKLENPFPLSQELIEKVFEDQGLPWEVRDFKSFRKGQEGYTIYNENEKITGFIITIGENNLKGLELHLIYPSPLASTSNIEGIKGEDWQKMFDLACHLYGGDRDSKKAYKQLKKYMKNESYEPPERLIRWNKKIGGIYYVTTLCPSAKNYEEFDLLRIELRNDAYMTVRDNKKKIQEEKK